MNEAKQSKFLNRITRGPLQNDRIIPKTLEFIQTQLPQWRDDPNRPANESEKSLNSTLCDFLEHRRRDMLPMARFKHESPQQGIRTVDIGVHGTSEEVLVGVSTYSFYEPFLVIECKRLPSLGGKHREQEYVAGYTKTGSPTGGIQRFKLGLHGKNVNTAVLIGYIQCNVPKHWHKTINNWIRELSKRIQKDGLSWNDDQLSKLTVNQVGTYCMESKHPRMSDESPIEIHHYWVPMLPETASGQVDANR